MKFYYKSTANIHVDLKWHLVWDFSSLQ